MWAAILLISGIMSVAVEAMAAARRTRKRSRDAARGEDEVHLLELQHSRAHSTSPESPGSAQCAEGVTEAEDMDAEAGANYLPWWFV